MNHRLEQFVSDHREEFDSEEPGKKLRSPATIAVARAYPLRLSPTRGSGPAGLTNRTTGLTTS